MQCFRMEVIVLRKNEKKKQIVIVAVLTIICLLIVIPFLLVVSVSLSKENDIVLNGYRLIPEHFTIDAYKYVFSSAQMVIDAYIVTFTFSIITMFFGVLLMAMLSYALTRNFLRCKTLLVFLLYFTMLFSGGLVPTYILNTRVLHLDNTILIYILPALINPWYVFMMRTFFQGLPNELSESAMIDGANEYTIFFRIVLPLSKPILATVALFIFLAKWNDWNTALLYIQNQKLISLQYLLQRIMENIALVQNMNMGTLTYTNAIDIPSETVRMAMAIVVAGPALFVFPFFQKYFVKGLTVGSVKG